MKTTISFLIFIICGNILLAQNKLTDNEKLATTAKVWGFLKYYHPNVASGKYNWDEQLFQVLPKVKNAMDNKQLSQVFLDWINGLGEIKKCKKCEQTSNYLFFDKNFDLKWTENNHVFTDELSDKLKYIEQNRHQGKKHYVSSDKRIRNIKITNEIDYKDFDWKNENLRLLTLFRYWNIVEYFFPYKYQTDTNWDEVLNKMIPKFLDPETETTFHLAILELVTSIDDSHGGFFSDKTQAFFGQYWMVAKFKLIDNKAIITGFYDDSLARLDDLRIGDIITKVNSIEVGQIFNEKKKYISGSNLSRKRANSFNSIFNGSSDSLEIEFIRDDVTYIKSIKRYLLKEMHFKRNDQLKNYKILDGNIGYVNMGGLKIKEVPEFKEALKNTKAIIFDIRSYPKADVYTIANYITSKRNDFYKKTYPFLDYPGKFILKEGNQCGKNGELEYEGKVVLLVNERSQSYAEFMTMCLQTGDHVTTLGSQTSGADGNMSRIEMVGGYRTAMSGIGIFYPDNTETQRRGVKIDIEAKPTILGIIDGKDEVLEKAIEFINQ